MPVNHLTAPNKATLQQHTSTQSSIKNAVSQCTYLLSKVLYLHSGALLSILFAGLTTATLCAHLSLAYRFANWHFSNLFQHLLFIVFSIVFVLIAVAAAWQLHCFVNLCFIILVVGFVLGSCLYENALYSPTFPTYVCCSCCFFYPGSVCRPTI